jgi:serine/threonine protein kinase/formylglycine-generating enzyme required for sulfatase activity
VNEDIDPEAEDDLDLILDQAFAAAGGQARQHNRETEQGVSAANDASSKYSVQGELGRGGVGIVHRGYDEELGRDVAMKFLRERFKDEPEVLHRFVEEAQIGGQLQHPGVVPVYDMGMSEGRPYFTMKLVQGATLAQKLSERRSAGASYMDFLGIFDQVCQTMAYAHARGVVHRDLKPANIMVGSFGEVQVVDWGMGKVLQRGGIADERRAAAQQSETSAIQTLRSQGEGTQSVMGSVMGTPGYMSPEQALGDVDAMDTRSDVFALGAILCELLTGAPSYRGSTVEQLRHASQARLEDAHARLEDCGADPSLIDLALRCLMPKQSERPYSAETVAKEMHAFLSAAEARVQQARIEVAEARVRENSLRRLQALGISLTLVIALGLAASLWFWQDADSQRKLAEDATRAAQSSAELALTARERAERSLASFNQLAFNVRLESAKAEERKLYPAWPENSAALRSWLEGDAKRLEEALPELRILLTDLVERADPLSEDQIREQAGRHPRATELSLLEAKLASRQAAHAVRTGQARFEPFALDETQAPTSLFALWDQARQLAGPSRKVFGREAEGLARIRRAVSLGPKSGPSHANLANMLSWSLFAVGLDDEALQTYTAMLPHFSPSQRPAYEQRQKLLERLIAEAKGSRGRAEIAALSKSILQLRERIHGDLELSFADPSDQFLHDNLSTLIGEIEVFRKEAISRARLRLRWSERVTQLTIQRHQQRWEAARKAIAAADGITASPLYGPGRLQVRPQLGLVPIGMNPKTQLWEFYHLRSAWEPSETPDPAALEIPRYGEDGKLQGSTAGIVFVLLPGGRLSQGEAASASVELEPFFLAKHELTMGQWARLNHGDYPSLVRMGQRLKGSPVPVGDSHPVTHVSWNACEQLLSRHALLLPTEVQWEYACRAGSTTPWFTGANAASLEGYANIKDLAATRDSTTFKGGVSFDDGFRWSSPVGTYRANAFGLHDMHGNLAEWCRDPFVEVEQIARRAGDGRQEGEVIQAQRPLRGGFFMSEAEAVRSSQRKAEDPSKRAAHIGARAARRMLP